VANRIAMIVANAVPRRSRAPLLKGE